MKTLAEKQQDYARLLLKEGLNLQKGQLLAIDCPVGTGVVCPHLRPSGL